MVNRTFFVDDSAERWSRSQSLPIQASSDDVGPSRYPKPRVRHDGRSSCEHDYARAAQQLVEGERARKRQRELFYEINTQVSEKATFEQTFLHSPSIAGAPQIDSKASVTEESFDLSIPGELTGLKPMERFLTITAGEEHLVGGAREQLATAGIERVEESSAHVRVQTAKFLAAEAQMKAERAKRRGLERLKDPGDAQEREQAERSWLDLDNSQESCVANARRSRRLSTSTTHGKRSPQTL